MICKPFTWLPQAISPSCSLGAINNIFANEREEDVLQCGIQRELHYINGDISHGEDGMSAVLTKRRGGQGEVHLIVAGLRSQIYLIKSLEGMAEMLELDDL